MRLLFDSSAEVAAWVARQIPHMAGGDFGPCAALGVIGEDGTPLGGVVYHMHSPQYGNIQLSIAAANPKWLTRNLISALLRYPFTQLGVQRVTAITPPNPETSVWRFLTRLGFQREGRVRKGLGTEDAVIWGLLASEWRTNRFNVERETKRRRRRRGTLHLPEGVVLQ